ARWLGALLVQGTVAAAARRPAARTGPGAVKSRRAGAEAAGRGAGGGRAARSARSARMLTISTGDLPMPSGAPPSEPIPLAVLRSALVTTLQNLIDRNADGRLRARFVQVVSNNGGAFGLVRADRPSIPTAVVNRKQCPSREEFSNCIFDLCRQAGA